MKIRDNYLSVAEMVSLFVGMFKSASRRVTLLEEKTGKTVSSFLVETRWVSWIDFCLFLNRNLDETSEFLPALIDEDCDSIGDLIQLVNSKELRSHLLQIHLTGKIKTIIRRLEKRDLPSHGQRNLIDGVREDLPEEFRDKLDDCLRKNSDYETIFNQASLKSDLNYLYVPLTSVEVKRSFSQLKNILTERKNQFSSKSLMQYPFVYFNQKV